MNTYTNAVGPKEKIYRTKNLFQGKTIMLIVLALITVAAIALSIANRSVVAENIATVRYGNALEMQYAQPWLDAQNKSVVEYSNALELQYARPWLESQKKPVAAYGNALEMQYAQPWLDKAHQLVAITGTSQNPPNCDSNLEMFYACKYGYGRP